MEEGERVRNEVGVPQGGVISPLLANIYLHYALDLWIMRKVKRELVIGCTDREDAQKVWGMLPDRLKQFGLELSPEKSRLMEFGRKAYLEGKKDGNRLGTFDFLGFTHYMTRSRKGRGKTGSEDDREAIQKHPDRHE